MFRYLIFVTVVAMFCSGRALAEEAINPEIAAAVDAAAYGKPDTAIDLTTRKLNGKQVQPEKRAYLLAARAYAWIDKGQLQKAKRDLGEALRIAPNQKTLDAVNNLVAQAYFQRAEYYDEKKNWERSIDAYTTMLEYSPNDPAAFLGRAEAHLFNCEFDEALSDYDLALKAGDHSTNIYLRRGGARELKFDFDGAIADYTEAIKLNAKYDVAFGLRGRAYAILENYGAARRDLESALALNPADRSSLLWLHLVHMHFGEDDIEWLRKQSRKVNVKYWPGPVIEYFLGSRTANDIVHIALNDQNTALAHQRCDGWFYLGEDALAHNDISRAKQLFQKTANGCNPIDYEWNAAKMELKRIAR